MTWSDESLAWLPTELSPTALTRRRLNLLHGDLLLPALVVKEPALANNIRVMAGWCQQHGVDLAPHVKVTMSPQIARRQVEAGAWGVTVATTSQAAVLRAHGFNRIMLANELAEPIAIRWFAEQMLLDPEFMPICWVDSVRGVEMLAQHLQAAGSERALPVLIECGQEGTRGGCRTTDQALAVAQAAERTGRVKIVGVAGYEATIERRAGDDAVAEVTAFLMAMRETAEFLAARGTFDPLDEVVLSAGGSTWFHQVASVLSRARLGRPARVVLRSGAYVLHDAGHNDERSVLGRLARPGQHLVEAAEVWGAVISRPEPHLALVGLGKRDVPTSTGLPVVRHWARDGRLRPVPQGVRLTWLNDQHAFLDIPPDSDLQVGDLIGCGLHYACCPGMQKWRSVPLVDEDYQVIDVIRAYP